VLPDLPKPSDPSTSTVAGSDHRSIVQEAAPHTPLAPVSIEALTSLQNIIVQDACILDETSKRNLERHLQNLTKAAGTFHPKNALRQHQISFLLKVKNQSNVRRANKSIVLGKAKVKSCGDLVGARATQSGKEAAIERREKEKSSWAESRWPKFKGIRLCGPDRASWQG